MIEINLLPGARKSKRSKGPALNIGAAMSGLLAQIKDPFLIFGVTGLVLGLAATGVLMTLLGRHTNALTEREQTAVQDSTRYAAVLAERENAEEQLDLVVRQFNVIQTIDGERYTWPHVLDELSQALPAYTWLRSVVQTSPVVSIAVRDSVAGPKTQKIEANASAAMAQINHLALTVIGQTVDIQAVTRYVRLLEQSPFIENVQIVNTNDAQSEGRPVTEFTLTMQFQQPDPSAIRTVRLSVAVR